VDVEAGADRAPAETRLGPGIDVVALLSRVAGSRLHARPGMGFRIRCRGLLVDAWRHWLLL